MSAGERAALVEEMEHEFWRIVPAGIEARGACITWAAAAVRVLIRHGTRALLQAGTCLWPREDPPNVSDTSHFGYLWEPDSEATRELLRLDQMPEMHVWAAIPTRGEIIDLSTRAMVEQCRQIVGKDWPAPAPPPWFWGTSDELPKTVIYAPDITATNLALRFAWEMEVLDARHILLMLKGEEPCRGSKRKP